MNNLKKKSSVDDSGADLLNGLSFCVFDLETTGGNQQTDKIIEIGLVKIENLEIVEKKQYIINPEMSIPGFIQRLTSIYQKDVANAPTIESVIDDIILFMGESVLVAHNVSFDVPFFNSVLERLSKPKLENRSICTNMMTKYLIPGLMNSNLGYMSKIFGIPHTKAHRALDDAIAAANLLLHYLEIFKNKGIKKINHLYYPKNRYELDRANFASEKHSLQDIDALLVPLKSSFLITVKGEQGVILFAFPCKNSVEEKKYIMDKLAGIEWVGVTVRLFGSFVEGLVQFNGLFNKLDSSLKYEIIKFMWKGHLNDFQRPDQLGGVSVTDADDQADAELFSDVIFRYLQDFIVVNHIVPEQYTIYPISSLHQNSKLTFRFPGHQKKLFQYIDSRSVKIANNKLIKINYSPLLKDFIYSYLYSMKSDGPSVFMFNNGSSASDRSGLVKKLNEFSKNNPEPYNYPKEYI